LFKLAVHIYTQNWSINVINEYLGNKENPVSTPVAVTMIGLSVWVELMISVVVDAHNTLRQEDGTTAEKRKATRKTQAGIVRSNPVNAPRKGLRPDGNWAAKEEGLVPEGQGPNEGSRPDCHLWMDGAAIVMALANTTLLGFATTCPYNDGTNGTNQTTLSFG
jgi:hypothetical protein